MSLGLEGAYGVDALSNSIRERIKEQIQADQQKFTNSLALRSADRADKQQAILQAEHEAALKERSALTNEKIGGDTATMLGAGQTVLSPQSPIASRLMNSSASALVQPDQTLPSTQIASGMPAIGGSGGTPIAATEQAPKLTGQLRFMGTPKANADQAQKVMFGQLIASLPVGSNERRALEYEQSTGKNIPSGIFDKAAPSGSTHDTASGLMNVVGGVAKPVLGPDGKPLQGFHPAPQPIVFTGANGPELVNRGTGVAAPIHEGSAAGAVVGPAEGAAMKTRLASAKAVTQTGNDMIAALSDPKLASQLGPLMSRYNNVADFVGNPPPEFAKLAGQIESYALANMGVHGMRANTGAEAIKATLGAGRHTPETIIAVIHGLNGFANHLMQNEGMQTPIAPASSNAPTVQKWVRRGGKLVPE